jgi:hypothetical protein
MARSGPMMTAGLLLFAKGWKLGAAAVATVVGGRGATRLAPDPLQATDWLVTAVTTPPTVTETTFGGVPALQFSNGLITRTFAMPPVPSGDDGCPNPGGRRVPEPDGTTYPYYGVTCSQPSDCGQCFLDHTCRCNVTAVAAGRVNSSAHPSAGAAAAVQCCVPVAPYSAYPGFATAALSRSGFTGPQSSQAQAAQLLRATAPEAQMVLDGVAYDVGGLVGQADFAFLNVSLVPQFSANPAAFAFRPPHRVSASTRKRFEWTPGQRHSDVTAAWPPSGATLELDFIAPSLTAGEFATGGGVPPAHQDVVVTVVYEMYTGIPVLSKWVRVASNGTVPVVVDALTMEVLPCTSAALGYWPSSRDGLLMAGSTTGRVHLSSEFSRDQGSTTRLYADPRCGTCTQVRVRFFSAAGCAAALLRVRACVRARVRGC